MTVSFSNLDGAWTLKFTGRFPLPGQEYDVPKRSGAKCHKTVERILRIDGAAVYTAYSPDCGRRPRPRHA